MGCLLVRFFILLSTNSYLFIPNTSTSGVTKVGVSRFVRQLMVSPIFPQQMSDDLFSHRPLNSRPHDLFSYRLVATPTLSAFQRRLSGVLCKFSRKN